MELFFEITGCIVEKEKEVDEKKKKKISEIEEYFGKMEFRMVDAPFGDG